MLKFTVISGTIPEGLRVIDAGGEALLEGLVPLDQSFNPPVFTSPAGRLAVVRAEQPADITIGWNPFPLRTKAPLSVVAGELPLGLRLSGSKIEGVPAPVAGDIYDFLPEDAPVWQTKAGRVAVTNEQVPFEGELLALGKDGAGVLYHVVQGILPAGLRLDPSSGVISGFVSEIEGEVDVEFIPPIWDTGRNLGIVYEKSTIEPIAISAFSISEEVTSIEYRVFHGALPNGLRLVGDQIVGTVAEYEGGDDERPEASVLPSGTNQSFTGTVDTAVDLTIAVSIPVGRVFDIIEIISGSLPNGVHLQGRKLVGTPKIAGTYNLTITVADNFNLYSNPFNITFEVT